MKGCVYKETTLFWKSIDKRMLLLMAGVMILLLWNVGASAGLLASVMLAMTVGMQNVTSFVSDEKVDWKKYQMTLPVDAASVVIAKYLSVICTLSVSLLGSVLLNCLSGAIFREFDLSAWGASAVAAVMIPLLWTGINLPINYWFGVRSAQVVRLLTIFPVFYFVKYFEDEAGFSAMTDSIVSHVAAAGAATAVFFLISMLISVAGYRRKK